MRAKKYSIKLYGHSTSVTIEPLFWQTIKEIAQKDGITLRQCIESIDEAGPENLSSALRVYVLERLRKDLTPR